MTLFVQVTEKLQGEDAEVRMREMVHVEAGRM